MPIDLKTYARLGAQARLADLQQEIDAILAAFPDLRAPVRGPAVRANTRSAAPTRTVAGGARTRQRRQPMSAAQRKVVGLRMKKYWAERRKLEAKS